MKFILVLILATICVASPLVTEAQSKIFGFHLMQKRRNLRVPFEFHSNLIIVPALINNSDTLHFILDTGVSSTIVTDPTLMEHINTEYVRNIELEGVGKDSSLKAIVSIGNTIRVGYARTYNHNLVVLEKDILSLSELIGSPIHGLIGYELFERFVITIDFRKREIHLRLPENYKYRRRDGAKIPLEVVEKKPYLTDIIIKEANNEQAVKLLLDTGAGHAMMLNTYATDLPLPDTTINVQLGIGLSGKINGQLGRLDQIKIGSYTLPSVLASFPDSVSFGMKLKDSDERQGNVGGELLRRFKVTINYAEGFMTLKPIKKAMKEPFEHDMSGMDLRAKGANFKEYYIERVIDNSPAEAAGLQKDDRLMFINNVPASELNMTEIYKLLQRKEGKEINLIIKRGGRLVLTSIVLKRII